MMDGASSGMFFGGGFMWIVWILLIILLVAGIRGLVGKTEPTPIIKDDSAMSILEKRFASSEIDEDEFKRRKKELES